MTKLTLQSVTPHPEPSARGIAGAGLRAVLFCGSAALAVADRVVSAALAQGPALETLHREYAEQGRLDDAAPVIARAAVDVAAPPDAVWALLRDIAGWPSWYPAVHHVVVAGEPVAGTGFTWWNGWSRMQSTVAVARPGREFSWTGVSLGIVAVHRNLVEPLPGGGSRLVSEESMNGRFLGRLFPAATLEKGLREWVEALARAARDRAVGGRAAGEAAGPTGQGR